MKNAPQWLVSIRDEFVEVSYFVVVRSPVTGL